MSGGDGERVVLALKIVALIDGQPSHGNGCHFLKRNLAMTWDCTCGAFDRKDQDIIDKAEELARLIVRQSDGRV